jgi:hypothetical protein
MRALATVFKIKSDKLPLFALQPLSFQTIVDRQAYNFDVPQIDRLLKSMNQAAKRVPYSTLAALEDCLAERLQQSKAPYETRQAQPLDLMPELPTAKLMMVLAHNGFHSEVLFNQLIATWEASLLTNFNDSEFVDGLAALSKTDFIEPRLLDWIKSVLRTHLGDFPVSSLITVLRSFVLLELYDEALIELAVQAVLSKGVSKVGLIQKAVLHSAFVGLEIDKPVLAKRLLAPFTALRAELKSSSAISSSVKASISEEKVADVLTRLGYRYTRHAPLADLYEIDFLVKGHNLAVEMLGRPYHMTLVGNRLTANTKLKTRHLKRSGLHVVNVFTTENLEDSLQKAIRSVLRSVSPVSAQISGDNQLSYLGQIQLVRAALIWGQWLR